ETAHRLLYERQDRGAVEPLRRLVRAGNDPRGRLHALYSLDGLGALEDDDLLAEPRLVRDPGLRAAVVRLVNDPGPRVRFQLAFTLGEMPGDEATSGLAAIARRDASDPWVRTALLSSANADPVGLFERLQADRAFAASADGTTLLRALALVV